VAEAESKVNVEAKAIFFKAFYKAKGRSSPTARAATNLSSLGGLLRRSLGLWDRSPALTSNESRGDAGDKKRSKEMSILSNKGRKDKENVKPARTVEAWCAGP
jgi:hypothetical protein